MNNKDGIINYIEENKIIAIVRGVGEDKIVQLVEAMYKGGIKLVEVTFDHSGRYSTDYIAKIIKLLTENFEDRVMIGAGTVLTKGEVQAAFDAGAKYIISPNIDEEVIKYTCELGMVSMPGGMSPTEIQHAYKCGADFVKIFPVNSFGPGYIKDIKAPLCHIKVLAVGGVTTENSAEFIKAGASGIGVGSNIINKLYIENNEFDKITKLASDYVKSLYI